MSYKILLHPKAAKSLKKLPPTLGKRVKEALAELESKPEKGDQLKPSDFWRVRIGDYRAIYEIDRKGNRIIVLYIGHRKNVYENFSRFL